MIAQADIAGASASPASSMWRGATAWTRTSDILAVLLAASLPWSTSLVAIFAALFLLSLIRNFDARAFLALLRQPACAVPLVLFGLSLLGTLWANDIAWSVRLNGISPVVKLAMIPLLIYHFRTSARGIWVFFALIASCTVVLLLSFYIHATGIMWTYWQGVPVKNYIAQSQEFTWCAFAAAGAASFAFLSRRKALAFAWAALSSVFIANMIFVTSSRTALACLPVLLAVFAFRHFGKRGVLTMIVCSVIVFLAAFSLSQDFRTRVSNVPAEYKAYVEENASTSTGMRLEFWRKSIKFFQEAPLFGHGTGTIKSLFERDAVGKTGVSSEIIGNPHNQTLNVAVQWGLLGIVVLYAMWISHLALFMKTGAAAWIGLVAVIENFVSSIFNSHLFDFTEGWLYVLVVGVAAGALKHARSEENPDRSGPAILYSSEAAR